MLNKQQEDSRTIQEIIEFYETEVASLALQVKLGDLRLGDNGSIEVCNKIFKGKPYWRKVNTDGTFGD
jgi:hypothetical protein